MAKAKLTKKDIVDTSIVSTPAVPLDPERQFVLETRQLFQDSQERKNAERLLGKYMTDYAINTIAERNALQQLIYFEVLQLRLQDNLNDMYSNNVKAVSSEIINMMHRNADAILKIKDTLGLNRSKEKLGAYDALEHLKKRFSKWREENQASRSLKCPCCKQFILLKMRTDIWEAQQHPMFKDNMIYNKHLFAHLGQNVEINSEFISRVLETSPDYVSWVIEKVRPHTQEAVKEVTEPIEPEVVMEVGEAQTERIVTNINEAKLVGE
jgi:DNA-directed RNA polymerase subunit RPC12/RpoP